ncbi:MAG: HD domain-containing protein [Bacteroidales bacterium]|uniref:HD domain-containing protein n=1 Tax=Porphyromonas sp. TaxID=1924944 RepID=UPI0029745782|nr:HD domain-containing protein [Porphyromonas sp.]MDD7438806.1 HD domain-containing protein [Bacteroidales bacterium]MDY3067932.1 HD domain-containing protein [Porphyromonas sp.]
MAKEKLIKSPKGALDVYDLLKKYYDPTSETYRILVAHSECVAKKALQIEKRHREWKLDRKLIYEGAMLHDIGIYLCDAPGVYCFGIEPYIRHGVLGREILEREGLNELALICERHTGVGLTLEMIQKRQLPLPHREMIPISLEEQIICFADCFFSKSGDPTEEKSVEQIARGMAKHGQDQVQKFEVWCKLFL